MYKCKLFLFLIGLSMYGNKAFGIQISYTNSIDTPVTLCCFDFCYELDSSWKKPELTQEIEFFSFELNDGNGNQLVFNCNYNMDFSNMDSLDHIDSVFVDGILVESLFLKYENNLFLILYSHIANTQITITVMDMKMEEFYRNQLVKTIWYKKRNW